MVADNQYSALGLLLIGCLARIQKAIKPLKRVEEVEEAVEQEYLIPHKVDEIDLGEKISRDHVHEVVHAEPKDVSDCRDDGRTRETNMGTDMDRQEEEVTKLPKREKKGKHGAMEDDQAKKTSSIDSSLTKRPKKKRKKGDAFDDLFAGLM